MSEGTTEVKRGLAGVIADTTAVSVIDEATGTLLYRCLLYTSRCV